MMPKMKNILPFYSLILEKIVSLQYELDEKMKIFVAHNQCFKTFFKKKCKM